MDGCFRFKNGRSPERDIVGEKPAVVASSKFRMLKRKRLTKNAAEQVRKGQIASEAAFQAKTDRSGCAAGASNGDGPQPKAGTQGVRAASCVTLTMEQEA